MNTAGTARSAPTDPGRYAAIPAEMRVLTRWVCFKIETRDGKTTKVPYAPHTGRKASSTDPGTWAPFDLACRAASSGRYNGLGFVFTDTPFFGVDLDHCAPGGVLSAEAQAAVDTFDTYAEFSVSGEGVHIIGRGATDRGYKRGDSEAYSEGRYFTVSGLQVPGSPPTTNAVQDTLDAFIAARFPQKSPAEKKAQSPTPARASVTSPGRPCRLSESDLLDKARRSKDGPAFSALYDRGDTSAYGGDASRADLALCRRLAFWLGADAAAVDAAFRSSALMRAKWDERHRRDDGATYGEMTVEQAVQGTTEVYEPSQPLRLAPDEVRPLPPDPQEADPDDSNPRAAEAPPEEDADQRGGTPELLGVMPLVQRELSAFPVQVHPLGLTLTKPRVTPGEVTVTVMEPTVTASQYAAIFKKVFRIKTYCDAAVSFCLGDLYNQLPRGYGDHKNWVKMHLGGGEATYQHLRKLAHVAGRWPQDQRRPGLTWSVFCEGASLSEEQRVDLVRRYDDGERVTVGAVKQEKAARRTTPKAPKEMVAVLCELVQKRGPEYAMQTLRLALAGALDETLGLPLEDMENGVEKSGAATADFSQKTANSHRNIVPTSEQCFVSESGLEDGEIPFEFAADEAAVDDVFEAAVDDPFAEIFDDPFPPDFDAPFGADEDAAGQEGVTDFGDSTFDAEGCETGPDECEVAAALAPDAPHPPLCIRYVEHAAAHSLFPPLAPVSECLCEPSWPKARARWLKFAGADGSVFDLESLAARQIDALRPMWEARHGP